MERCRGGKWYRETLRLGVFVKGFVGVFRCFLCGLLIVIFSGIFVVSYRFSFEL